MGRVQRVDVGGMVYHALNRANFRSVLFKKKAHYQDFLALVAEGADVVRMRILAYCLMSNHWHMVLYPRAEGDLSRSLPRIDPHAALSRQDPDGRIRPHLPRRI
jgi:putative transposase